MSEERYAVAVPKEWLNPNRKKEKWGPHIKVFEVKPKETEGYLNERLNCSNYKVHRIALDLKEALTLGREFYRERSTWPPATNPKGGKIKELRDRSYQSIF